MTFDSTPAEAGAVTERLRAAGCVFAEDEAALFIAAASSGDHLNAMVARRESGLPLEVVIGWADFCGVRVLVDAGVFVPRHRSELLVQQAVALTQPGDLVVDLCCGSGALGLAVAAAVPGIELHCADIDPVATASARRNLAGGRGSVHDGDLFAALPVNLRGRVATLIVNAPYVPSGQVEILPREARLHEPRSALDGGADGLDIHRRVAMEAAHWLRYEGSVVIETSADQAPVVSRLFAQAALVHRIHRDDELEATVVSGQRSQPTNE